jgi:hypothetical protein
MDNELHISHVKYNRMQFFLAKEFDPKEEIPMMRYLLVLLDGFAPYSKK